MEKRVNFDFEYDKEDDVISIYDLKKPIFESIEFNEFINVDLGKKGEVVGIEILEASKFFGVLNDELDRNFLENIKKVDLVQKDYRNNIFIAVVLYSSNREIYQQLPPLQKRNYVSPLIAQA